MHRLAARRALAVVALAGAATTSAACGARLTAAQHAAGIAVLSRPGASQGVPQRATAAGPTGVAQVLPVDATADRAAAGMGPTTAVPFAPDGPAPAQPSTGGTRVAPARTTSPPAKAPDARPSSCAAGSLEATDTGVSPAAVRVGSSADVSGPIPGLFSSAQNGAKAFVAYFNGTGQTLCGRSLVLDTYDSQTSESGDHDAAAAACSRDFALVGSISAFDAGGAEVVRACGIPDLRAEVTTGARQRIPNTFGTASNVETAYPSTTPDHFKAQLGSAYQHAAFLYINAGAGAEQGPLQEKAWASDGFVFVYTAPIDISDFNYSPFVQAMKSKGVQIVLFVGSDSQAANMMKAIRSQDFHPGAVILSSSVYGEAFPQFAGEAATGAYTFIPGRLFDEGGGAETQLYQQWLARVAPNDAPSFFGEFAWSAMRLFVEQAQKVGPHLTRKGLLDALRTVKDWTDHGLHAPQQVGAKTTGVCETVIQWNGSAWVRVTPAPWVCGHLLSSAG